MDTITFTEADLDRKRIQEAYNFNSYFPEKRAETHIRGYVEHMNGLAAELLQHAETDEARAEITEDLRWYRDGYIKRFYAWMAAKGRTANWAVTGPANFPVARNQKRLDTEYRRMMELSDWSKKHVKRLKAKYDPRMQARKAIRGSDPDAIEALEAKIRSKEAMQGIMKAANKVARRQGLPEAEKIAALVALGLSERHAHTLLHPYYGPVGFARWQLSNNNAEIRRLRQRLEKLQREAETPNAEIEGEGYRVIDNMEAKRVQVFFDGKPDAETRARLKANGFRWAPSVGAWQAYQNTRARDFIKTL